MKVGNIVGHNTWGFKKEILIGEGERLIGLKGQRNPCSPRLNDIQFIVGQMK